MWLLKSVLKEGRYVLPPSYQLDYSVIEGVQTVSLDNEEESYELRMMEQQNRKKSSVILKLPYIPDLHASFTCMRNKILSCLRHWHLERFFLSLTAKPNLN